MDTQSPPIYAKRGDDKKYDVLDGQQRLTTVSKFINDEYALSELPELVVTDEATGETNKYSVSGLKFSKFPEELQEIIKGFTFSIIYFDDITQEEVREIFIRLNNGKPLSTKEKNISFCKRIDDLMELGTHSVFESMLTKKSYDAKSYVPIIAKIHQMLDKDIKDVVFSGTKFNEYIEDISLDQEEKSRILTLLDDIEFIHNMIAEDTEKASKNIAKKMYKETHFVSLSPWIWEAHKRGIDASIVADWIMKFFAPEDKLSVDEEYNDACLSGTAKPENIQKRHKAVKENFESFFEKRNDEKSE